MNSRSFILSTAMASLIWPAASGTQALAADHPAVQFTRKVADDLIRAQMIGTAVNEKERPFLQKELDPPFKDEG